jgi:hypothetical protein
MDVTVLSQLPVSIPSEARLAFLMLDRGRSKQGNKGTLHKRMVVATKSQNVQNVTMENRTETTTNFTGIESFFSSRKVSIENTDYGCLETKQAATGR